MPRLNKSPIDWENLELDYRAGAQVVYLANKYKCATNTIYIRARKEKWVRDLIPLVRARVREAMAGPADPALERGRANLVSLLDGKIDDATAKAAEVQAQVQIAVLREHRADLATMRSISHHIMMRMQEQEEVVDADGKGTGKWAPALKPQVVGGMFRDLSVGLGKLIPLERQAYGMDKTQGTDPNAPLAVTINIGAGARRLPAPRGPQAAREGEDPMPFEVPVSVEIGRGAGQGE